MGGRDAGEFEQEVHGQTLPARLPRGQLISCWFAFPGLAADHGRELFPIQARPPTKPAHGMRYLGCDLPGAPCAREAETSCILSGSALLHEPRHRTEDLVPGSALVAGVCFLPASDLQAIAGLLEAVDAHLCASSWLHWSGSRLMPPTERAVQLHAVHVNGPAGSLESRERRTHASVADTGHAARVVGTSHHDGWALIPATEGTPITRGPFLSTHPPPKDATGPAGRGTLTDSGSLEGTPKPTHLPDL